MKRRLFLFTLFASLSTLLPAQVGDSYSSPQFELVGEVESLRRFIRLEQRDIGEGNKLYKFSFSDREYIHLNYVGIVLFTASEKELKTFKNYLLKGFELENDSDIRFKLGKSDIVIRKFSGRTIKMTVYDEGGFDKKSAYIKPREIPLIFNEG